MRFSGSDLLCATELETFEGPAWDVLWLSASMESNRSIIDVPGWMLGDNDGVPGEQSSKFARIDCGRYLTGTVIIDLMSALPSGMGSPDKEAKLDTEAMIEAHRKDDDGKADKRDVDPV